MLTLRTRQRGNLPFKPSGMTIRSMPLSFKAILGTVGAIVSGVLFDATGSFASTWIVCLACSVVMLVFLLASEPIAAKLRASVAWE